MKGSPMQRNFGIGVSPVKQFSPPSKPEIKSSDKKYDVIPGSDDTYGDMYTYKGELGLGNTGGMSFTKEAANEALDNYKKYREMMDKGDFYVEGASDPERKGKYMDYRDLQDAMEKAKNTVRAFRYQQRTDTLAPDDVETPTKQMLFDDARGGGGGGGKVNSATMAIDRLNKMNKKQLDGLNAERIKRGLKPVDRVI